MQMMQHMRLWYSSRLIVKGIFLSKSLTCMKFFLYKQKMLFYQGDGYIWPHCCMNNLYISHRSLYAQHTAFEQSKARFNSFFRVTSWYLENISKYCSPIIVVRAHATVFFSKVHPACHNIANCIKPGSDSKNTDKHAADCSKAVFLGVNICYGRRR